MEHTRLSASRIVRFQFVHCFCFPPGANPDAPLKRVLENVLLTSKEGVHVYDAFKQRSW